jgi:hypothetical protein
MAYGIAFEFMDVGMGDGTLIQLPPWDRGGLCLIDFGERLSPSKYPAWGATKFAIERIAAVCNNRGLPGPELEFLFITHGDRDHWNKLQWLIDGDMRPTYAAHDLWNVWGGYPPGTRLTIRNLVFGGDWAGDYVAKEPAIAAAIAARTVNVIHLGNNDHDPEVMGVVTPRWVWRPGVADETTNIYLLGSNEPYKAAVGDPNPKSLFLLFQYKGFKALFTGDGESAIAEPAVLANYPASGILQSTALKLGHHGSASSTSANWALAVQPRLIFASGDRHWGHPYCDPIVRCLPYVANAPDYRRYACSFSGAANDYVNNRTQQKVCMNLWYVVTNPLGDTLPDVSGVMKTGAFGTYFGVQWRMQFDSASVDPYISWASVDEWPAP